MQKGLVQAKPWAAQPAPLPSAESSRLPQMAPAADPLWNWI